jgi:twitching motility protein PilT
MRDGKLDGMQDFDSVIKELIRQRVISIEDGLAFATNQNNLLLSLQGLGSTEDFIRAEIDRIPFGSLAEPSMLSMIEQD